MSIIRSWFWSFSIGGLSLFALPACSDGGGEEDDSDSGQPSINLDGNTASSGGSSSGNASSGSGGGSDGTSGGTSSGSGSGEVIGVNGTPGACESLEIESGCAGSLYEGEVVPLDLYVMFDQSGSMATVIDEDTGETRIDAVTSAMQEFLLDWQSAGITVGLGHFGHFPLGETSCNENDYAQPVVDMGLLPGHAQTVIDALSDMEPTGETPTAAGIRGACQVTSAWKDDHPGNVVVNLIVTDGEPKAPITSKEGVCVPTLDDAVAAAAECAEVGVPSYVLGVGPSLDNLNRIAEAGETSKAHLVAQDSSQGVLDALNAIRGDAQIPCEIDVPTDGSTLNFAETDVVYMDGECVVRRITRVESAAGCDDSDGGWYLEEGTQPRIVLCDRTCGDVRQPGAEFFYSVGCGIKDIH